MALPLGIALIMGNFVKNANSVGRISVGFGILFSGILKMTKAVNALSQSGLIEGLFSNPGKNPVPGYLSGVGVAFVLQSYSSTIGILQAFSSTGLLTFKSIYSVVVGIYLGACVTTAIVCSIGARNDTKRVGVINILFNLSETVLVPAAVSVIHKFEFLDALWDSPVNLRIIANTNTIFNLGCSIVLFPLLGIYEKLSYHIVKDKPEKDSRYKSVTDSLNPVFFDTPALALESCYKTLLTIFTTARSNIEKSLMLLKEYDPGVHEEILEEENEIDRMPNRISKYIAGFLPHVQLENHIAILNQYHKITYEFERLSDHAVNIAALAKQMTKNNTKFSSAAINEFEVPESLLADILNETERTFSKRDVDAAVRIEPLVQISRELIALLRSNHLIRMSTGECNPYSDAIFTHLMVEVERIGDVSSNVGAATFIRVYPEIADHEHSYFDNLRSGDDESFNTVYNREHQRYFALLHNR